MDLILKGRDIEISDALRDYVHKKVGKLDRYLDSIIEARVELAVQSTRSEGKLQVAQITLRVNGKILRAEEKTGDIFASIDTAVDKMHRQVEKYKGKRLDRWQGKLVEKPPERIEETEEEESPRIVRRKRFSMHPMDEREAIEQMELLGHNFFVFYDVESGSVNVVYRRRDGNYGVIEPEPA